MVIFSSLKHQLTAEISLPVAELERIDKRMRTQSSALPWLNKTLATMGKSLLEERRDGLPVSQETVPDAYVKRSYGRSIAAPL